MTKRLFLATMLVLAACASEPSAVRTSTPVPTEPGKHAPDFTLATFDGDTFTLSDHFGELPIVLNFWAPW